MTAPTPASPNRALDQYPTPAWVAEAIVERYFPGLDDSDMVIEPSCGDGRFLNALPRDVRALGIEIDPILAQTARDNTGREILTGDFLTVPLSVQATAIIGNPPFGQRTIDAFIARSHGLLVEGGRAGFILPAYTLQSALRMSRYSESWSILCDLIPRAVFPRISLPLVFAVFSKDARRVLIGFSLFREMADAQRLREPYKSAVARAKGSLWRAVCEVALRRLGGEGTLAQIYAELEGNRPYTTRFWRDKIRQTLREYPSSFTPLGVGNFRLVPHAAMGA